MKPTRIVHRVPVDRLWDENGDLEASRERWLTKPALREMLRRHPVEFFVANVGDPLRRVDAAKCYGFWKSEAKLHVVDNPDEFYLEDFPGEYAYVASEWSGRIQTPIILLEMHY
jgi:hypothetical protein